MNQKPKREITTLPMLPLRGLVVFPNCVVTLDAGRERSVAAVNEALQRYDGEMFVVAQRNSMTEHPQLADLYTVGTIVRIKQTLPMPDQTVRLLVEGTARGMLLDVLESGDTQHAQIAVQRDAENDISYEQAARMNMIVKLARMVLKQRGNKMPDLIATLEGEKNPAVLCDMAASAVILEIDAKQKLLETFDVNMRLEDTMDALAEEISIAELEEKLQQRVREAMDRANHEYYLREQIRAIQDELGDDGDEEIAEYRAKLAESKMPDEARDKVSRELKRLARTAAQSPESSVSQNYIEYMLELPWGVRQESEINVIRARRVLDEDHYGLKEVKDRLIEYLAVRKYTDNLKSPIICLVGPPGVGKTSIAKSIARALNRKFTQMSLGGVHDEAEIRGHRKTYIGAMPGRIITSIHQCGTTNPVFLLDEIDKIAHDMRGDPAAALLEALDPEQNQNFKDHYIEAPFDLSDVLFITTANSTDPIDRALLDRMEVIEVPSYTQQEKCKIAKNYLLPKQMAAHGLKKGQLKITERTIMEMIDGYTRESGVRNLERIAEKLCRKAVLELTENPDKKSVCVKATDLKTYLGAKRYLRQPTENEPRVGVVNGLAWTSVGGEVMPVEALAMDGKGAMEITGKLGEVMQESAKLARSIVRVCAKERGIPAEFFEKHDLHIHVPEGAVPKDGPSAGVALTCALLSAVTGVPARGDVAMTGEVTLHGMVLPIGGVREKLLAAYRMGITRILLPRENEKDLQEIEHAIVNQMDITLIDHVQEAIKIVLDGASNMRLAI